MRLGLIRCFMWWKVRVYWQKVCHARLVQHGVSSELLIDS